MRRYNAAVMRSRRHVTSTVLSVDVLHTTLREKTQYQGKSRAFKNMVPVGSAGANPEAQRFAAQGPVPLREPPNSTKKIPCLAHEYLEV